MTANQVTVDPANDSKCNDAGQAQHNIKTVECQLERTFEKLAATEANMEMFNTLIKLNLATNDIRNFVLKQTTHKRTSKTPDLKTQRVAMLSKLKDACCFASRLRQQRDTLKTQLAKKYSSKKALGRRILTGLVKKYRQCRQNELNECRKKVDHLKSKNDMDKLIRTAPENTREFLDIELFDADQHSLKPQKPETPFICDPTIKLSEDELALLVKGPKFMFREELSKKKFELELEKMVAKKKYDSHFRMEDDCLDTQTAATINQQSESNEQLRSDLGENFKLNDTNNEKIDPWVENESKMTYNLKDKTLNLANLQACAYKHNKEIFLPNPESPNKETAHEFRKREMLRIFDRAINKGRPNNSDSNQSESNLTPAELRGLKSLKRRVAKGEIVVADTDKSKKFCILSQKQYIEAGMSHASKYLEIEPHHVKKIQKSVNDHVYWASKIFQHGKNWNQSDRMATNLIDKGEQTCNMTLLIKDHKSWVPESNSFPPTRPVVAGNSGLNCHLSEIVSSIIEPIAFEESGNEVVSTNDILARLTKINDKLARSKDVVLESHPNLPMTRNVEVKKQINERTKIFQTEKISLNDCSPLSKGDIRSFFKPVDEIAKESKIEQVKSTNERIEILKSNRQKDNCLPVLEDRLEASWLSDRLLGGEAIVLPGTDESVEVSPKQKESGVAIIGADVCSLFPSMRSVDTARLVKKAVLESSVNFGDIDYNIALRYISLVGGNKLLDRNGCLG